MREIHDKALKEWAFVCEAMKSGRQTVLIRKGGIREEDGVFRVDDPEFFLMPTYEHEDPRLLQQSAIPDFDRHRASLADPRSVTISAYAVVDTVRAVADESLLRALSREHVWNNEYIRMRLDFNPYDPLYVMILRTYLLPESVTLPMRPEYGGCKSWVTLERPLSTLGASPAIDDQEFNRRREETLSIIGRADT